MINNNVFIIGKKINININNYNIVLINSYKEINPKNIGIIIINDINQDSILEKIHKTKLFWGWKIYTIENSKYTKILSDGIFNNNKINQQWEKHKIKYDSIKNKNFNKFILWLWLDKNRTLKPYKDINIKSLFTYPLLDCYENAENNTQNYLNYLQSEELIKKTMLINRVRYCKECGSGHLNYIETCPSCNSFDVKKISSLHCFNCGHVEDQNKFFKNNIIECPNCYNKLKHIGVDYDRPIENYSCNCCEHKFSDPETRAVCLTCDYKNNINNLNINNINEYTIGKKSSDLIEFGNQIKIPKLNIEGNVNFEYFINMIEWINKISIRHNQEHLIVCININQKRNNINNSKIISLTTEINNRFNDFLRNTDICTQPQPDSILLFLPMNGKNNINIIQKKISNLENLINNDFELIISLNYLPQKKYINNIQNWLNQIIEESNND